MKYSQKELQKRLDELLKDCKESGFKITSQNKIKEDKPIKEKLAFEVYINKNRRYVGEIGWLRTEISGNQSISKGLTSLIETNKPNKIEFNKKHILFDEEIVSDRNFIMDIDELYDYTLIFYKDKTQDKLMYQLDLEDSDISLGDPDSDEYSMIELDVSIEYITKSKGLNEKEYTD